MTRLEGRLVLPQGWVAGRLEFDRDDCGAYCRSRRERPLSAAGFIDTHVHGGGGGDTMDGPDGVRTLAAFISLTAPPPFTQPP
jgi:N-acetylglucosamine-6-phosphate deacetylase